MERIQVRYDDMEYFISEDAAVAFSTSVPWMVRKLTKAVSVTKTDAVGSRQTLFN